MLQYVKVIIAYKYHMCVDFQAQICYNNKGVKEQNPYPVKEKEQKNSSKII